MVCGVSRIQEMGTKSRYPVVSWHSYVLLTGSTDYCQLTECSWGWKNSHGVSQGVGQVLKSNTDWVRSIIVNYLQEQFGNAGNVAIACIYFDYNVRDVQSLVNIFSDIYKQLLHNHRVIPEDLAALYERCRSRGTRPKMSMIMDILHSEIKRHSRVYVVIDALDECSEDDQASLIYELRNLEPQINLLVTSRFLESITDIFRGQPSLQISAHYGDVEAYIWHRIHNESRLSKQIRKDPAFGAKIVEAVAEKAQSMYGPYISPRRDLNI